MKILKQPSLKMLQWSVNYRPIWNKWGGKESQQQQKKIKETRDNPTIRADFNALLSVQFSHSAVSNPVWPHELQHVRPPCPSPTPRVYSNSCSLSGEAIHPFHPLSSPSPPAFNLSQHQGLFQWVNSSHEVAKELEFQLQHQSFQRTPRTDLLYDGLVGSPCSPRDSQESSPTPQFKSINSSVLSFLYSPTLTSIHDYWKNHSLDQTDLCWQSNISAF